MSGSMDDLDNRRTLGLLHFGEELFATIGAAKHGHDALYMRNVFRKIPRGRAMSRKKDSGEELQNFAFSSSLH